MSFKFASLPDDFAREIFTSSELSSQQDFLWHQVNAEATDAMQIAETLLCHQRCHYGSYLYEPGQVLPYLLLDETENKLRPEIRKKLYLRALISTEALIPLDFQALVAELLLKAWQNGAVSLSTNDLEPLRNCAAKPHAMAIRSLEQISRIKTDGIDHLFPIPDTPQKRLSLLKEVNDLKSLERTSMVCNRLLSKVDGSQVPASLVGKGQRSRKVEQLIESDLNLLLLSGADFLVPWSQVVTHAQTGALTLAEVTRIVFLASEFKLPDEEARLTLIGFYRSALRICGRAIIGLGSGVLPVEHGLKNDPSYFFLGRGAIMGKGSMVDGVGGTVLLSECFIGGGFMPILIHTHKHMRNANESAARERRSLLPVIFVMRAGSRFPMSRVGFFEAADFIDTPSGLDGVEAWSIDPVEDP